MHQIEIVYFIVEYVKRLTWVTLLKHQDYGYKRIIQKAITSASTVCIGSNVLLGSGVRIFDTDFHPISANDRKKGILDCIKTAPVKIEDNVFIGTDTIILKGVTIGPNSVIGAGSIVTKDIPKNVVAYGQPCTIKREINDHDKIYYYKERKIKSV